MRLRANRQTDIQIDTFVAILRSPEAAEGRVAEQVKEETERTGQLESSRESFLVKYIVKCKNIDFLIRPRA